MGAAYRYATCTGSQCIDTGGAALAQPMQRVVDGHALEQVATVGIEGHLNR
ncbi:hypothetical protein D3C76_1484400 [compost metagenome]